MRDQWRDACTERGGECETRRPYVGCLFGVDDRAPAIQLLLLSFTLILKLDHTASRATQRRIVPH